MLAAVLWLGVGRNRAIQSGSGAPEELSQMRRELAGLKEQVARTRLEQQSASERLRGVEMVVQSKLPSEEAIASLIHALSFDPNVNVRLGALEALGQYATGANVRNALLDSLGHEKCPLVQVELIDLLVEQRERSAVPVLKALLESADIHSSVRKRAELGLRQLG
jgi:HEAT repeat protein